MFWLLLAMMTIYALVMMAFPLLRQTDSLSRLDDNEMDRELTLSDTDGAATTRVILGLMLVIPALVVALYLFLGQPAMPTAEQGESSNTTSPMQTTQAADIDTLFNKLKQRLEKNPDDGNGWMMVGLTYMHYQQYPQAVEAYQKAVQLLPGDTNAEAGLQRAQAAASGKPLDEPQPQPSSLVAVEKKMMGPNGQIVDVGMMVNRLRAKMESNPDNLNGWLMLGRSYTQLQQHDEAVYAYEHALNLSPDSTEIQQLLTTAHIAAESPPNMSR